MAFSGRIDSFCDMSRYFRPWTIDQARLLPAAVADYVPADHLAQFVVALAREHLDLSEIVASYKSGLGQPPFDPRMMTALLLYADCSGLYSSRRIAKACAERVDFMMIVAHDAPDSDDRRLQEASSVAAGEAIFRVLKLAKKPGWRSWGMSRSTARRSRRTPPNTRRSLRRVKTRDGASRRSGSLA